MIMAYNPKMVYIVFVWLHWFNYIIVNVFITIVYNIFSASDNKENKKTPSVKYLNDIKIDKEKIKYIKYFFS